MMKIPTGPHLCEGERLTDKKGRFSGAKKLLMVYLWRVQQSQAIIGIIFWSLTLTGVFYGYAKYYIERYFGVSGVISGLVVLFAITLISIIFVGYVFDKLKFWKEQSIVLTERNPYSTYKLCAKEISTVKKIWLPILKSLSKNDEEAREHVEFVEKWMDRLVADDPVLKKDVEFVERWVMHEETIEEKKEFE